MAFSSISAFGFGNGPLTPISQIYQAGDSVAFGGTARLTADMMSVEGAQRGPVYNGPGASRSDAYKFTLAKLSRSQKEAVQRAKKYAMEQGIKTVLLKQTIAHQQQQMLNVQQSIQKQQALALMCRVYVGTINFAIKEDTVKQAFAPFGPIKSISLPYDSVLKKHKGFAFIEYEIPEAASLALEQMNGVMICGFSIKVGRPSNMPQAQPIIERLMEEAKSYNRIFVASIHPDLSEHDVRSVFEAFGKIVSCKLATETTRPGKHKGYGYIEYETAEAVQDAITAMNLFDLGGQYLRVGKCVTPPNANQVQVTPSALPTASAIAAAAITAKLNAWDAVNAPVVPLPTIVRPTVVAAPSPFTMQLPQDQPGIVTQLASSLFAPAQLTGTNIPATGFSPMVPNAGLVSIPLVGALQTSVPTVTNLDIPTSIEANMELSNSMAKPAAELEVRTNLEQQEYVASNGSETQQIVMEKPTSNMKSHVMVLKNMVGPEDVDEDLEFEVREECSKYGSVLRILIHEEQHRLVGDEVLGNVPETVIKIFVEFTCQSEAEAAVSAMDGRYFAGRSIIAKLYDQELFNAKDLSG